MKALIQTGSSGRVPAPLKSDFLSFSRSAGLGPQQWPLAEYRSTSRFLSLFLLMLGLFSSCGCALYSRKVYSGPVRPEHEVAWLRHPSEVRLVGIDGRVPRYEYARGSWWSLRGGATEVIAGPHTLLIAYNGPHWQSDEPVLMHWDAEPGGVYRIDPGLTISGSWMDSRLNREARWDPSIRKVSKKEAP